MTETMKVMVWWLGMGVGVSAVLLGLAGLCEIATGKRRNTGGRYKWPYLKTSRDS